MNCKKVFSWGTLAVFFLLLLCGSAVAGLLEVGQHSDITTNNYWAHMGPKSEVWNTYTSGGIYPAVFSTVAPTWQLVPSLASRMFDPADFHVLPLAEVFPEGVPADREEFFLDDGEPIEELMYVDIPLYDFVEWSDGTPVTAHDVAFTHMITLELGAVALGGNHPNLTPPDVIAKVEALDDYTVRYYLIKEDARFMFQALPRSIVAHHYWEPLIEEFLLQEEPLEALFAYEDTQDEPSAGGFLRGRWERGAFIDRDVNPHYTWKGAWEKFYDDGSYRFIFPPQDIDVVYHGDADGEIWIHTESGPFVEGVLHSIYTDQSTAVMALSRGDIDFLFNPVGLEAGFQEQLSDVPGIAMISNPAYGIRFMGFNMRKEPFDDLAFRQAFATLIDREFVCERVLQGVAIPLASVMPPGNVAWFNEDVTVYGEGMGRAERVEEAVRILSEAGYTWAVLPEVDHDRDEVSVRGRGLTMPDGSRVEEFELLAPGQAYDPLRTTFAMFIERWANEVGIPMHTRLTDFSLIVERVFNQQDFDAWMLGWSLGNPAFPTYFNVFFHSRYTEPGGFNAQGFVNSEYDALVEEFLATLDIEEAQKICFRLQEILAEELPYIVLFDTEIVEAYREDRLVFPFTEVLGGLQFIGGMLGTVQFMQ